MPAVELALHRCTTLKLVWLLGPENSGLASQRISFTGSDSRQVKVVLFPWSMETSLFGVTLIHVLALPDVLPLKRQNKIDIEDGMFI